MMKYIVLLIIGCSLFGEVKGQTQQLFDEYMSKVGDHSELYMGKIEYGYSSTAYMSHPYWGTDEFLEGTVVFNGLLYRNVRFRFDAYLQQLIVKAPVKGAFVCVPMQKVDGFAWDDMKFVRWNGKFVALLFDGTRVKLVEQQQLYRKEKLTDAGRAQYGFGRDVKYYVLSDKGEYEVDKLKSVLKLYPEIKKELKAFANMNRLNFKEYRSSSLVSVIQYAEALLAESSK